MGTTYSGYYDEPLYNIVGGPFADVNLKDTTDHTLFKENAMPWDRLLTGGYMSLIYFLWLAIMVFLNFCLFTYVLEWAIQINFILALTEASVVVVGLIWSCIWAAMGDNDIRRLAYNKDQVSLLGMLHARRSRANNSTDVSLMISGLFLVVFELWFVCLYIYGGVHNNWLNGWSSTVNYPLTRTATFATLTAANVQQVMFRAFIHLFIVIKGLILICAIFFTRANAVYLNDHRERTYAKVQHAKQNAIASAEDVLHLAGNNGGVRSTASALKA